jgi:hypothetical protein
MEFSYFIARNRFNLTSWLVSMNITTFKELLTFCESNDLKPPSKCPDELQVDIQVVTHNNAQAMPMQEKPLLINSTDASVVSAPSKDDKLVPVSQNLADHGVYVDSNEALKDRTDSPNRKTRKKPPLSREKNAKKS